MLPHDPDPADDAAPHEPQAPQPTGLVDSANLTPVPTAPVQPRRGWPFAASIVLVAVMAGGALFMSGYSIGRDKGLAPTSALSDAQAWQPFWDVFKAITERYPLEPVERNTLIEGAIRGMVESVGDPYSSYLSPEDFTGTLNDISGTFEGIGGDQVAIPCQMQDDGIGLGKAPAVIQFDDRHLAHRAQCQEFRRAALLLHDVDVDPPIGQP